MRAHGLALLVALPVAAGCTTLSVERVAPGNPSPPQGQHYFLPKLALHVLPKPDGRIEATLVRVPDPDHEYVIKANSWFSGHALGIDLEGGMLKQVSWDASSAAVAGDVITATGQITAEALKASAQAEHDRQTKVEEAQAAVATANTEIAKTQAEIAILESDASKAGTVQELKVKLAKQQIDQQAAQAKLAAAKSKDYGGSIGDLEYAASSVKDASIATAMAPSAPKRYPAAGPHSITAGPYNWNVHGGHLLAIEEGTVGGQPAVRLRDVSYKGSGSDPASQQAFASQAQPGPKLEITPRTEVRIEEGQPKSLEVSFAATRILKSVTSAEVIGFGEKLPAVARLEPDGRKLVVKLPERVIAEGSAGITSHLNIVYEYVDDDGNTVSDLHAPGLVIKPSPEIRLMGSRVHVARPDEVGRFSVVLPLSHEAEVDRHAATCWRLSPRQAPGRDEDVDAAPLVLADGVVVAVEPADDGGPTMEDWDTSSRSPCDKLLTKLSLDHKLEPVGQGLATWIEGGTRLHVAFDGIPGGEYVVTAAVRHAGMVEGHSCILADVLLKRGPKGLAPLVYPEGISAIEKGEDGIARVKCEALYSGELALAAGASCRTGDQPCEHPVGVELVKDQSRNCLVITCGPVAQVPAGTHDVLVPFVDAWDIRQTQLGSWNVKFHVPGAVADPLATR